MSLTSNLLNPILSGSTLTLTCTVELSPAVNIPVTVNTEWTRPTIATLDRTTSLQESLTIYRSENGLNSVESADSGQYSCIIEIVSGVKLSASTNIEIGTQCMVYDILSL